MRKFEEVICSHFRDLYPREGCGVLATSNNRLKWIPIENISLEQHSFKFNSEEWIDTILKYDILAIVHNHVETSNEPSKSDIFNCNLVNLPYWIYSYPTMELKVLLPDKFIKPLWGREYIFGESDCFQLVRDYYTSVGVPTIPRGNWQNQWWKTGKDYFSNDFITSIGWQENTNNLQVNDLIIFDIGNNGVGDHCGIYVGEGKIAHHFTNRLSCIEDLQPVWERTIYKVYTNAA